MGGSGGTLSDAHSEVDAGGEGVDGDSGGDGPINCDTVTCLSCYICAFRSACTAPHDNCVNDYNCGLSEQRFMNCLSPGDPTYCYNNGGQIGKDLFVCTICDSCPTICNAAAQPMCTD